jgi:hypothetical protein
MDQYIAREHRLDQMYGKVATSRRGFSDCLKWRRRGRLLIA